MAGQGETCSHIGVLLYWVEYTVRRRDETCCTSLTNCWMEPSTISTVPYLQIQDIDFTSPEKQMKMSKPADIAVSVRLNLANHHFFTPIIVL